MITKTRERRLELLKLEGMGFNRREIVKELSAKFRCCERTVYHDFETRTRWQQYSTKEMALMILNRFNQIYRRAAVNLMTSMNENAKVGWARIMLGANKALAAHFIIPSIMERIEALETRMR